MRIATVCLISALALTAACSKKPAASAAADGAPAAADKAQTATAEVKPTGGPFKPKPRVGLWTMSMNTTGGPGVKMNAQMCIGPDTAADMAWHGPRSPGKNCTQQMHPSMGGLTFDSTCRMGKGTMTSHGVVSGDLNSAYTVDMTTHMDPPQAGMSDMKMSTQAKWLGPCPAGMKPGQVNVGGIHVGG